MSIAYSTGTKPAGLAHFTVITAERVYRIRAASEVAIRAAFTAVGLAVLGVDRDDQDA